jgi:murein hydrolase activator
MASRLFRRALALVLAWGLGCLASAPAPLRAASAQDIGERQADLDEVKTRLKQLQKDISDTEESRSAAAEALATAEKAFSVATRKARDLAQARQQTEQEVQRLEAEQHALDARIADRQKDLGAWLRHYYTHDQGERVARLFDTGDPNQLARNAYYMERAGAASRQVVDALRTDLQDKTRISGEMRGRQEELAEVEDAQRRESEILEKLQAERKAALTEVSAQLSTQRQTAAELQRDEQRLGQLIAGLKRIAREQAARAAARAAAEAKAAAEAETRRRAAEAAARRPSVASAPSRPQPQSREREEAVVGRVDQVAGAASTPTPTGVNFAQLQGRLPAPLRGELIGRFGAPRAGGGTTWKGVFIRASAGAEVRAVAAGEVVFSDWLRGFGNLIIVDHGGDFLTIYGNNDALLHTNGERVASGEPVASVGASGGGGESGLYFEIRRQGQALDPLKWIRLQ